ncbi:hypothetical protein EYF80_065118 [Liparis tanakae]|uniref:Uncharacterized protein n=1 Tax=Liparis tanakae TaxID=230148 RepID=A0A4Z2E755_9TELE|nr:hypothetical protein EYF80_065118 [Liparis tanakae]
MQTELANTTRVCVRGLSTVCSTDTLQSPALFYFIIRSPANLPQQYGAISGLGEAAAESEETGLLERNGTRPPSFLPGALFISSCPPIWPAIPETRPAGECRSIQGLFVRWR